MKKNTKVLTYAGIGVAVAGIIVLAIIRKKNKKAIQQINDILDAKIKDPNASSSGQTIITKSERDKLPDGRFPLKFGDKNKKVYDLQNLINKKYGLSIDLDGRFGQSTASALCKNYYTFCYTDVQSRLYEITENDFRNLSKTSNFDGIY